MGISPYPSQVVLPDVGKPYPTLMDFLVARFPAVGQQRWEQRVQEGKVLADDGRPITSTSSYQPRSRIFYFREVEQEPAIPFTEEILFQDDHLLVACKPHFLPVTPGGAYVEECLLNRLKKRTGTGYLAPIHRIDRGTAGLVMFSVNSKTSDKYHQLFREGRVEKTYLAASVCVVEPRQVAWLIENRIVAGEPWFRMKISPGIVNARSRIMIMESGDTVTRFMLSPLTGRTHSCGCT